jgi:hypothetical protein
MPAHIATVLPASFSVICARAVPAGELAMKTVALPIKK